MIDLDRGSGSVNKPSYNDIRSARNEIKLLEGKTLQKLKFFGKNSGQNFYGSFTSAYIVLNNCLVIFDVGDGVSFKIVHSGIIKNNKFDKIYFLITHYHGDHIGGLPSVLEYIRYTTNSHTPVIICTDSLDKMNAYLGMTGMSTYVNEVLVPSEWNKFTEDTKILLKYIHQPHTNDSIGFLFYNPDDKSAIYYSGDTNNHLNVVPLLKSLDIEYLDCYVDSSGRANTKAHCNQERLREFVCILSELLKGKFFWIYLMHLDQSWYYKDYELLPVMSFVTCDAVKD